MTLSGSESIVILTGSGISSESGLETFRAVDGTWAKHRIEDVCTPAALARNPRLVHDFYNSRRRQLQQAEIAPNAAHVALADLERRWPGTFLLVTQNIDDLHERGGSTKPIHMHGEMLKVRCDVCATVFPWTGDLGVETPCPDCGRSGNMRPHIVFFQEMPFHMDEIMHELDHCQLFVAIGTSGSVYPAAGFVEHARHDAQAHTVELNLEPSAGASHFAECIYGPATKVVPEFVARLLREAGVS